MTSPESLMGVGIPCVASDEVMVYLSLRLGDGIIRPHCLKGCIRLGIITVLITNVKVL